MEIQKTILKICMQKGFLLDKEILELLSGLDEEQARKMIDGIENLKIQERVITKAFFSKNFEKIRKILINGSSKTVVENFFVSLGYSKTEICENEVNSNEVDLKNNLDEENGIKLISAPMIIPKRLEVRDFVEYFKSRYEQIKRILESRELENLSSIRKIGFKRESYTIIACILNKRMTKSKNIILEVEDPTGKISVLVNQNKKELFEKAKDLLLDDIVAIPVSGSSEFLFANDIIYPDCFVQEKKKIDKDIWVAFSSDWHVGSTMFLEEKLMKFVKWINGEEGDEKQREIAKKIKYLILNGDNVDGVGVYPGQEKFLNINDMTAQYKKLSEILKLIRDDVKIIMGPGQHDSVWVGLPQPSIKEDYGKDLMSIKNLILVPNPCMFEIEGSFKILMTHGASMHPIVSEIEDIRLNYGHNFPTRIARELLKRRHLAPTHGMMDYVPVDKKDPLVIEQTPDIFTTADLHRAEVSIYNNILIIASSCWQSITPFEEKVGNHPDPCKVPLFNLRSREIKILDFSGQENEHALLEGEKIGNEVKT